MALNASQIAAIKDNIKNVIKTRIGYRTFTAADIQVDQGDGTYNKVPYQQQDDPVTGNPMPREVTTLDFNDLENVIDVIVEEICDQLSQSIVSHFKQAAQINIITGILANGGSTSGFGGPGAGLMVTGTCAVPNTIT